MQIVNHIHLVDVFFESLVHAVALEVVGEHFFIEEPLVDVSIGF